MKDLLQINTTAVTILGSFNPAIFQPAWFGMKKIIGEVESEGAKIEIVHRDIVRFKLDWLELEVTPDRFVAVTSKEAYFEPLRDFISSTFILLRETPVTAFGINHTMHFKLRNDEDYSNFGNFLAPLSTWSKVFGNPKLLILEILDNKRVDGVDGFYRMNIRPSDLITTLGLSTNLNNHMNVESKKAEDMISILKAQWENSFTTNEKLIEELWTKFKTN